MKGLNYIGVTLGISILTMLSMGISQPLFHLISGMLCLLYVSVYAGIVMTSYHPVPGLRIIEVNLGRGAINALMLTIVLSTMVYTGYGVRSWLMLVSSTL